MFKLKVLGSSSSGNSYIISNDRECIVIDAGIPFMEVKKALDFNTSIINGVCFGHSHLDHSKYLCEYNKCGIDIYGSEGELKAMNLSGYNIHQMIHGSVYKIGGFSVMPFNVIHDSPEPLGFLIKTPDGILIVYITDSSYSPYKFSNVNVWMLEANFDQLIIDDHVLNGRIKPFIRKRIMASHMSLQTCKELLKANDLSQTRNIVLIHLSDGNSNAAEFKKDIEGLTGKPTYIADKGLIIDLNKNPF